MDEPILEEIRKLPSGASMDQLKDRWYRGRDGSDYHYHQSRYHAFYAQEKSYAENLLEQTLLRDCSPEISA